MTELALSYSFLTKPNVLQADADATLMIIVSNSGKLVTIDGLDIQLTQGANARDLVGSVTPQLTGAPEGWSAPSPTGGKFQLTPKDPVEIGREGLIFTFAFTVNSEVGTGAINLTEHLEVDGRRRANNGTLLVPKFPHSFALDGFYSTTPIVDQGNNVTLVWTGENLQLANYKLSYSDGTRLIVADIPARTYSYTIDNIGASTVFYLHVSASDADASVTFASQEYPIEVNPAITEFWSSSPYPTPGSDTTLNWTVASSVASGRLTCLQSGDSVDLDAAALAKGNYQFRLPAISITTQFRFDVFDATGQGTPTASSTITLALSPSIPQLGSATVYSFTAAQAADIVTLLPARPVTDMVTPAMIEEIFALFELYYPDIDFFLDWESADANTKSFRYIDGRKKFVICGGLARCEILFYEALCFFIAEGIARLSGTTPVDSLGMTYIGVADFQATSSVLRTVFNIVTTDDDLNSGILAQMKTLFKTGISPQNQGPDPGNIANNPGVACRYNALSTGIFGGNVPSCATGSGGSTAEVLADPLWNA